MKRSRYVAIAATLVAIPVIVATTAARAGQHTRGSSALLGQVFSLARDRFVDTLTDDALYERAARGLVRELNDPYSSLYNVKELQAFNVNSGGRYAGLGILVEEQNSSTVVAKIFPDSPAEKGGMLEGDRFVAVNGVPTAGWPMSRVTDSIKGTPGTTVEVSIARTGVSAPITMRLPRALVHQPAVPYSTFLAPGIGYVPLQQFSESSADETRKAVAKLVGQGAKGIILDLRDNGGGVVDQSLAIANLFLPLGSKLLETRGREGMIERSVARMQPLVPDLPVVVLVDAGTASASEIVAGALQDHDRAILLGEPTFGKGLVQSLYPLDGGWALKLTTGRWFTPSGRTIHKKRQPNGALVPDSDSLKRPTFTSDAGRTLTGSGGIHPDLLVKPDTLAKSEQTFAAAVRQKSDVFYRVLYAYSLELKTQSDSAVTIRAEWREELHRRLAAQGLDIPRATYDSARPFVDRLLGSRVARFAFGDSGAMQRFYADDRQVARAVDLLKQSATTKALFAKANDVVKTAKN